MSNVPVLSDLVFPTAPVMASVMALQSNPGVAESRRLREELLGLLRAVNAREKLLEANREVIGAWINNADNNNNSNNTVRGKSNNDSTLSLDSITPNPSSSSGAKTIPQAFKTVQSPQLESLAKKRKPTDDLENSALLYRKTTDDGSVKIAISSNGKMKVKIADPPPSSAVVSSSSASKTVPPGIMGPGSKTIPASVAATHHAQQLHQQQQQQLAQTSIHAFFPPSASSTSTSYNQQLQQQPLQQFVRPQNVNSNNNVNAQNINVAGAGAAAAGAGGGGFAKPKPHGFPKVQKSKSAKNPASFEKARVRNRNRKGGGARSEQVLNEEDAASLTEADLAIQRGDYSNAKAPATQIPITQFFSFLDSQFFRPLGDDDLAFLETDGDDITPYIIPRLGKTYHEQWAEEDSALPPANTHSQPVYGAEVSALLGIAATPPPAAPGPREYEEVNDTVYGGDVYIGPLSERLLSTLVEEGSVNPAAIDLEAVRRFGEDDESDGPVVPSRPGINATCRTTSDVIGLEERLRNELKYLGLFGDEEAGPDEVDPTEQNEICTELRAIQRDLRDQVEENKKRKQVLLERATYYRGWEQYNSVLDAISKQIESDYLKRFRQNPNKKKKSGGSSRPSNIGIGTPLGGALSSKHHNIHDQTLDNIKKRRMLIDSIGSLFPYEKVTIPTESIYPAPVVVEEATVAVGNGTAAATVVTPVDVPAGDVGGTDDGMEGVESVEGVSTPVV
ncbi:UNVERIFIED_CONTAM: Transcriptional regulator [Siphonaria sp. JEL0065]|nr:Transcriptional regulator [Siphonaria sp. JEL0065]